jgi:alkanesulfonate monooxygenase SsuD/methylene tetrahydromethanopterin reductase-like flavin-dependent oxidoreductase (luciferase family)
MSAERRQECPGARQIQIGFRAPRSLPDSFLWLSYVAAVTDHMLIGAVTLLLRLHNPLVMAKRLATFDQMSGGLLGIGIGLGWNEAGSGRWGRASVRLAGAVT